MPPRKQPSQLETVNSHVNCGIDKVKEKIEVILVELGEIRTSINNMDNTIKTLHNEIYGNGDGGLKVQVARIFAVSSTLAVVLSFIVNLSFIFFSGK